MPKSPHTVTDGEAHGHPVTYRPGDRITVLFDGRRYVGTVTAAPHPSGFEVEWDHGQGRARFVHGGEPATLRHAHPHDSLDESAGLARSARQEEIRELLAHHQDWPRHVLDALRLRLRTLTQGEDA